MTDYTISPAYEIVNYAWTRLKAAGVLDANDYFLESIGDNIMPIFPVQEQPSLNLDLEHKTFFVYEYIVQPTGSDFWNKSGQIVLFCYDTDFNKLAEICEFFQDEFDRKDITAQDINAGLLSTKYDFKHVSLGSVNLDRVAYDDDGRMSAEIVIDFSYTRLITSRDGRFN